MEFEWNEDKNNRNITNRGIDFADAKILFERPFLNWIDERKSYGEERFVGIGELHGEIVTVVYTFRKENICRIISLRRARKDEQRKYSALQKRYEE